MGQLFELIADHALEKLDDYYDECHVCDQTAVDLYRYQGKLHLENGEIDDDIYAVCTDCLLTKKLTHSCDFDYIRTITNYLATSSLSIEEQESMRQILIEKYQKTPDVPLFMQYVDRPLCCNDITMFTGHPTDKAELYRMTENVIYWEKQIKEKSGGYNFRESGNPESFREVASFQCRHCGRNYFTFQFT
ncbi:hypothetical protein [Pedobacter caeni]|uniref:Uncharacterized protein family (UPF0167) n=1 Tax=Pedobacter caeni TaxID=288992 RepID=A0A1M5DTY1_9SPHI|nr:hypothetical protein [Pedobacter caeni]SHF70376.1 Uncharacterised protein family (UPF0167) [Pedobacter caeni]